MLCMFEFVGLVIPVIFSTHTHTDTHTAVSVGCLAAGTEAVIGTQCQSRSVVTVEPEGTTKVPISSPTLSSPSLHSLLFSLSMMK